MPDATTISYQMTLDELVQASFRRKFVQPRFLVPLAVMLILGAVLLFTGDATFYLGVFCIGYAVFAPLQLYQAIRRLVKGVSWFTAPTTLRFDHSGVSVMAPGHRFETAWSVFRSWAQTGEHLFLFIDEGGDSALTIPKRAFGAEQMQTFQSYLMRFAVPARH